MANLRDYQDWRPSTRQELLLKAALFNGELAFQAWREWRRDYDPARLDYGSQRLLPLLYRNLKTLGIEDPELSQFKRAYLDTWAKNKILFSKIAWPLQAFREAGIDTLVLKGTSLIVHYYQDYGVRPMNDFDFLVPTSRAPEAVALLRRLGWQPQLKHPDRSLEAYLSVNYALHFSNATGCDIDLHWHVLNECLGPRSDDNFWTAAVPIKVGNVESLSLNPSDDLFHICLHGTHWNKMPPIRWVADAMVLLGSGVQVDWERLFEQASQRALSLPLAAALGCLVERFDVPVPSGFLDRLKRLPVSRDERREFHTRMIRPGWSSYIASMWASYPRIFRDTGSQPGVLGFAKYLQSFWELDHVWQVPLYAAWRSVKRLVV